MWSFNYFSNVVSGIINEGPQQMNIDQKENRAPSEPHTQKKVHGVKNTWLKRGQKSKKAQNGKRAQNPKMGQKGKLAKIKRLKRIGKTWWRVSNREFLCIFKLFEITSHIYSVCVCMMRCDAVRCDAIE